MDIDEEMRKFTEGFAYKSSNEKRNKMINDINFDTLPSDIQKAFTSMALSARAAQRLNMSQEEFVEFAKECWISVDVNGDNIEDAITGWCAKEIKDKFDIQFS